MAIRELDNWVTPLKKKNKLLDKQLKELDKQIKEIEKISLKEYKEAQKDKFYQNNYSSEEREIIKKWAKVNSINY